MITRKPIWPKDVERGAQALYAHVNPIAHQIPWDDLWATAQEQYLRQAQEVLEAVFPHDRAVLAQWRKQIDEILEIL